MRKANIKYITFSILVALSTLSSCVKEYEYNEGELPPDYEEELPVVPMDTVGLPTNLKGYSYILPRVLTSDGRIYVKGNPPMYTDTAKYHVVSVPYNLSDTTLFDLQSYYASAVGKKGDDLKNAIAAIIIANYNAVSYGDARYVLEDADNDPVSGDTWCFYNELTGEANWDAGVTWNREHVWAQSRGLRPEGGSNASNSTIGIASDIHNLKAENPGVNSTKSNRDFESNADADFYGTHGVYSYVPMTSARGDVARIMFYMELRWGDDKGLYLDDLSENSTNSGDGGPARQGRVSNLVDWHSIDPVDPFEIRRNNIVHKHQNNRNPFVDHPELVDHIYGNKQDVAWDGGVVYSIN